MTRTELNTVLIDAVKKSSELDSKFPPLKMFAEIKEVQALHGGQLDLDSLHTGNNGDYFYSSKSAATKNPLEVEYPALLLVDTGTQLRGVFEGGNLKKTHQLQLIVAVPNTDNFITDSKKAILKAEMTKYCEEQLDFIFRFIWDYNDTNDKQENNRLKQFNGTIQVNKNEDFSGFAIAFAALNLPTCIYYDFVKNTRREHCC